MTVPSRNFWRPPAIQNSIIKNLTLAYRPTASYGMHISFSLYNCGEITCYAAVVDLNVGKQKVDESPFRICEDFDSLSWLLKCFSESQLLDNRILKSKRKQ